MQRFLAPLSTGALLCAAALAQCPQGANANLVQWDALDGFATPFSADDEGITAPPIALTSPFPMVGALGTLDRLWVNSNGELYLTDSAAALTEPVEAALYGVTSTGELRGDFANASARIVVCGADHQGSIAAGAQWDVSVDTSLPNEVRVTWYDVRRFDNQTGDKFAFTVRLFLTGHPNAGAVEMSYGTLPSATRFVGISIGNNVGPAATSSDLSGGANSGTLGLLFEAFTAATWDLNNQSLTLTPNGTGGYVASAAPFSSAACAFAAPFGSGCYTLAGDNSVHQVFAGSPAAKAALDGNSMTFLRTATGYVAVWNGPSGPAFVAPGGGATTLLFDPFDQDDSNEAITPSAPIPVPGGTAATWNVSINGILTAAAAANNAFDFSPTAAEMTSAADAPSLGFYTWRDFLLDDSVANGTITTEEVGGVLYVSWNAVEAYPFGTVNPSTWQYQINLTTGDVTLVWVSFDPSTSGSNVLVGATLQGAGTTPGAVTLSTGLPVTLTQYLPLTLTASGRPVITGGGTGPSEVVTLTATNIPDAAPPFGISLGFLIFSLGAIPGGIDLGPAGVDVGMPGCSLYVASFDVLFGFPGTQIGTQVLFSAAIPQPLAPGLNFYAQALALFPPNSLPGGLNNFGGLLSNGVQLHFENQ